MQSGAGPGPEDAEASSPSAQGVPGPWAEPSLAQVGIVLLLVGWIITLVMMLAAVVGVVVMMAMRPFGRWFMDEMVWWMGPDMMFDFPFQGMVVAFSVIVFLTLGSATVLLVMSWSLARQGEGRRAGVLGVVGGTLAVVFSTLLGVVGLLGGIFVLVAAGKNGGATGTPPPAASRAEQAGPVAGQWPPPRGRVVGLLHPSSKPPSLGTPSPSSWTRLSRRRSSGAIRMHR